MHPIPPNPCRILHRQAHIDRISGTTDSCYREAISLHVLCVWLLDLVEHLASRLRHHRLQARTLDIKIRSADFRTQLRQQAPAEPTNQTNALWRAAKMLFERSLTPDLLPVRLLGVGASRLTHEGLVQDSLFDDGDRQRQQSLDTAVDAIRGQFGGAAIRRGSLLDRPGKPPR